MKLISRSGAAFLATFEELREMIQAEGLLVVGAEYSLETDVVEFFES